MFVHKTLAESLFGDVPCVPASHLVMYYNRLRLTEKDNQKTRLQLQYEVKIFLITLFSIFFFN